MRREGWVREKYSRLAFFNVCIFVTASEGEEFIVDIIGRHCGRVWAEFRGKFLGDTGGDGGENGDLLGMP